MVQQRKLIALQAWGRTNGITRSDEEWEAFTAAEFKTYLEIYTAESASTSGTGTVQAESPNKRKTVEEKFTYSTDLET